MLKIENILKSHRFVINDYFIKCFLTFNLNIDEFLLLVYYDNNPYEEFNIIRVSEVFGISDARVMEALNNLVNLKLLNINCVKDSKGKMIELVSLDGIYNKIKDEHDNEAKKDEKISIFGSFESGFGRPLSSIEVEIINTWIDSGISEELIIGALNEAVYNGASNIRYIDKILLEWKKKKYTSMADVKGFVKKEKPVNNVELFDYDWTSDYEE